MKRVAINGFGRIGRAYFRLAHFCDDIEIVAINDLTDVDTGAYLLKYDSVYGKFDDAISVKDEVLQVGKSGVAWLSVKNPSEAPWRALDVSVVIESTGVFASYEKAYGHIAAGAEHTIITAPVKDNAPENTSAKTVLVEVNTDQAKGCTITSNASCTTNAVGIPLAALDQEVGVESAILNTIHSSTASQQIVDSVSKKKNTMRFGRSSALNIIPSSTGAAAATAQALPEMRGKFDGVALRVPTVAGSVVDVTFVAKRNTTIKEVNKILTESSGGLFSVTDEEVVLSDIIGEPFVSIADLSLTRVVGGRLVKVFLWYDNEVGYAQSLIEHTRSV